jgi:phytoene synthase
MPCAPTSPKKNYKSYAELKKYMYGSAEVIGLMMAQIMNLPEKSYKYAQAQGRAMQLINFIRDLDEDRQLGRNYLAYSTPISELRRYARIQNLASLGYQYIPKRYLIPIKTASDMYGWTAAKIMKDPSILYRKKIKPKPIRVVAQLVYNAFKV